MVLPVQITDLKSVGPKGPCGFKSRHRHQDFKWEKASGLDPEAFSRLPGQLIKNICSPIRRLPFRKLRKIRSTPIALRQTLDDGEAEAMALATELHPVALKR